MEKQNVKISIWQLQLFVKCEKKQEDVGKTGLLIILGYLLFILWHFAMAYKNVSLVQAY